LSEGPTGLSTTRGDGRVRVWTNRNDLQHRFETHVQWRRIAPDLSAQTPFDGALWITTDEEAFDYGLAGLKEVHASEVEWFDYFFLETITDDAELARRFASARADVRLLDWKLDSVVRAVDGLPAAPKPR
jgi:hypothetical protein